MGKWRGNHWEKRLCHWLLFTQGGVQPLNKIGGVHHPPDFGRIVAKMVRLAAKSVKYLKQKTFLVLDAYFASNVAFEEAAKVKDHLGQSLLTIIVRAKANFVAFEQAIVTPTKRRGRGRPAKYGKKLILKELFDSRSKDFQPAKVMLYGKLETIEYLCLDLLWKPAKGLIRFVLVKHGICYQT